ncbi:MAG TPA: hypothetical protein VGP45_11825, partial [Marinobacter sp.]|nr:hypothetical protein [Marinobacter sp.]
QVDTNTTATAAGMHRNRPAWQKNRLRDSGKTLVFEAPLWTAAMSAGSVFTVKLLLIKRFGR